MIPEKVAEILARHGLEALEFEPGSTPTSQMAAARIGVAVAQIAKSILLKGKDDRYYLAVCRGDTRLDNKKLKDALGVRTRMATADETEAATGFRPGGVCPFGITGIEIVIDHGLAGYATIYPAAGTDASGVPMTFGQLCTVTGGRPCDLVSEPASNS